MNRGLLIPSGQRVKSKLCQCELSLTVVDNKEVCSDKRRWNSACGGVVGGGASLLLV